jgi:hypothetical protein
MKEILKEYVAKLDSKNRLTVRGSKYIYYRVSELGDGTIILRPRVLIDPDELSANTLRMIDKSMKNFEKGVVSKPVDIDKYLDTVDEDR